MAVNQTLMRSINTSLIALLPVAGLLFVGAGILGVGTIKDLALILFVGLASGAYSSLFLATPIVVDLTEREPAYKALTKRVVGQAGQRAARRGDAESSGRPARRRPRRPRRRSRRGVRRRPRRPGARPQAPQAPCAGRRQSTRSSPSAIAGLLRDVPDFPQPGVAVQGHHRRCWPTARPSPRSSTRWPRSRLGRRRSTWSPGSRRAASCSPARWPRQLGCGLVPVRKAGKLPPPTVRRDVRPRVRHRRDRGAGRRARRQAGAAGRRRAGHRRHPARRRRAARRGRGRRSSAMARDRRARLPRRPRRLGGTCPATVLV